MSEDQKGTAVSKQIKEEPTTSMESSNRAKIESVKAEPESEIINSRQQTNGTVKGAETKPFLGLKQAPPTTSRKAKQPAASRKPASKLPANKSAPRTPAKRATARVPARKQVAKPPVTTSTAAQKRKATTSGKYGQSKRPCLRESLPQVAVNSGQELCSENPANGQDIVFWTSSEDSSYDESDFSSDFEESDEDDESESGFDSDDESDNQDSDFEGQDDDGKIQRDSYRSQIHYSDGTTISTTTISFKYSMKTGRY